MVPVEQLPFMNAASMTIQFALHLLETLVRSQ
jgi:hypothetical protein